MTYQIEIIEFSTLKRFWKAWKGAFLLFCPEFLNDFNAEKLKSLVALTGRVAAFQAAACLQD